MNDLVAGVDIGGTKIAAGLVAGDGHIARTRQCPTPAGGAGAVLDAVDGLIEALTGDQPVEAIGVGAPGVVDADTGVVRSATDILPGWAGAAVAPRLRTRFGVPVAVDNDVRTMAYGEARSGAGRGLGHTLYVSVGTGVGGAIVRNGHLDRGGTGSAGEIAHLLVAEAGPIACGCGRRDHLEAVASGPAMAAAYATRVGRGTCTLHEVAARARAGEREAGAVLADGAAVLGRALAGLVTAVDFDAVVVGGGVATIGPAFTDPLVRALRSEVRPAGRPLPVSEATLGTAAPLIGAALLAAEHATTAKEYR